MSDQNNRGSGKHGKRQRSGGQGHDNYDRRSNDNEQRNDQRKDMQPFFSDNQQFSAPPPGSDRRLPKYDNSGRGNIRPFPVRSQNQGQGQRGQQRGLRGRTFSMKNNDRDHQGNFYSQNASKQGNNNYADQNQAAACTMVKAEPYDTNSDKLLDSESGISGIAIPTKSGVFKCEPNLTDEKRSIKSDPDNPHDSDERGKRHTKGSEKSCIKEIEGDLFTAPEDVSLAHCVGADLRMGSGIAVRFRNEFRSVGKLFDQRVEPGGVAHIPDGKRFVFYLITKQFSCERPTNSTMRQTLLTLRDRCKILGVTKIAMPQIGCGQDGLSWDDVKQMLMEIFSNGFEITIYKLAEDFVEKSAPGSKSRVETVQGFLKDVEPGTGLLYISCSDLSVSDEMRSIDSKYDFLTRLRPISSELGFTISTKIPSGKHHDDVLYGLTCKKSAKDPVSYEYLELAIQKLEKINTRLKHRFEWFGLQAFKQENDPFVMDKIDTLLRNSGIDAVFLIFWPPSLRRPSISGQNSESIKVQGGQNFSARSQQPIFSHSSHSAVPPEDQQLKEVESKMNSHSLAAKSKPEPSHSMETMEWENPPPVPEVYETTSLRGDPEDDEDWLKTSNLEEEPDENPQAYADSERRKSREKKEANEMRKQKEKQDRRSGGQKKSCVTECKGDLFDAEKTMCLAHCVGADFRMGAGIAVIFRQKFGCVPYLLDQRVDQGGVAYLEKDNRYIFYLVTKRESNGKPTYETMRRSLNALHEKCKELNVTELAMPRIGCGLDRLEWSRVKNMLDEIFFDGFAIKIYNLEKPMYNSTAGGRSSWFETDTIQQNSMIRDVQRTAESTHRRLLIMGDKMEELFGPNGCKASARRIEDRFDQFAKEIQEYLCEISSKIDDSIKEARANSEAVESLQHRVTYLEMENVNLVKRLEVVERYLHHPLATNGPMHPFPQLEGPPPLVQSRELQHYQINMMRAGLYPPGYNGTFFTSSHGNPPPSIPGRVYAPEHLPGEREALFFRVQNLAADLGYKSFDASGKIFVFTKEDRSDAVQINSHGDLTRFCQQIRKDAPFSPVVFPS